MNSLKIPDDHQVERSEDWRSKQVGLQDGFEQSGQYDDKRFNTRQYQIDSLGLTSLNFDETLDNHQQQILSCYIASPLHKGFLARMATHYFNFLDCATLLVKKITRKNS